MKIISLVLSLLFHLIAFSAEGRSSKLAHDRDEDTLLIVIHGISTKNLAIYNLTVSQHYKKNAKVITLDRYMIDIEYNSQFNYTLFIHLFEKDSSRIENTAIYTFIDKFKGFKVDWLFSSEEDIPNFKTFLTELRSSENRSQIVLGEDVLKGMLFDERMYEPTGEKEIVLDKVRNLSSSTLESIDATILITTPFGHASGFFIDSTHVITNFHALTNVVSAIGTNNDGLHFSLLLEKTDKENDLAILRTNYMSEFCLNVFPDMNIGKIGTSVYVVGSPASDELMNTISGGIISGERILFERKLLQIDAPVNPGNSGGPLLDENGNLLGVIVAKIADLGTEGIAFAIPTKQIIDSFKLLP